MSTEHNFLAVDPKSWDIISIDNQDLNMNEAYAYRTKTLADWKDKKNGRTMVSLAKFAHRWNAEVSPKARKKLLQSEINDLNRVIERRKKMGESYEVYSKDLASVASELTRLREKYPEEA